MATLSEVLGDLMAGLIFFRQQRLDGGIRTGISLAGNTVLERFEIDEEYDPSLIWSVDLRCKGPELPKTPDDARDWLLAHEPEICRGFERYAEYLRAGSDPTGDLLLEWADFPDPPPSGVTMKIVCGAMRRIDAMTLSYHLAEIALNWAMLVRGLQPRLREAS